METRSVGPLELVGRRLDGEPGVTIEAAVPDLGVMRDIAFPLTRDDVEALHAWLVGWMAELPLRHEYIDGLGESPGGDTARMKTRRRPRK